MNFTETKESPHTPNSWEPLYIFGNAGKAAIIVFQMQIVGNVNFAHLFQFLVTMIDTAATNILLDRMPIINLF